MAGLSKKFVRVHTRMNGKSYLNLVWGAHIPSVAVADRFGILVAEQGQMLDTERRTCTASGKI